MGFPKRYDIIVSTVSFLHTWIICVYSLMLNMQFGPAVRPCVFPPQSCRHIWPKSHRTCSCPNYSHNMLDPIANAQPTSRIHHRRKMSSVWCWDHILWISVRHLSEPFRWSPLLSGPPSQTLLPLIYTDIFLLQRPAVLAVHVLKQKQVRIEQQEGTLMAFKDAGRQKEAASANKMFRRN